MPRTTQDSIERKSFITSEGVESLSEVQVSGRGCRSPTKYKEAEQGGYCIILGIRMKSGRCICRRLWEPLPAAPSLCGSPAEDELPSKPRHDATAWQYPPPRPRLQTTFPHATPSIAYLPFLLTFHTCQRQGKQLSVLHVMGSSCLQKLSSDIECADHI